MSVSEVQSHVESLLLASKAEDWEVKKVYSFEKLSGVDGSHLSFDLPVGDHKVTATYSLGLDGVSLVQLAYQGLVWVVNNPEVLEYIKTLVRAWVGANLPVLAPLVNAVLNGNTLPVTK